MRSLQITLKSFISDLKRGKAGSNDYWNRVKCEVWNGFLHMWLTQSSTKRMHWLSVKSKDSTWLHNATLYGYPYLSCNFFILCFYMGNPYLHSTVKGKQKGFLHLFYDVSSVATLAQAHILLEGAIILIKIISDVIFIDLYHLTTSTLPVIIFTVQEQLHKHIM